MLGASCHCGGVRLEIERRPRQLTDCNCSICRRYGALWAYYSRRSVRVLCPPDALQAYVGRKKALEFYHCRRCGCVMFHERARKRGDETRIAINARMMAPQDVAALRIRRLDGAASWRYLD